MEGRLHGHLHAGRGRHGVRGQPGRQPGECLSLSSEGQLTTVILLPEHQTCRDS